MEREELFEVPKGRSETIPNQALHIADLMNRSARLQQFPIFPDSEEDDDNLDNDRLDDIEDRFDIYDRLNYLEARQKEHQRLIEEHKAKKEKQTEAKSETNEQKEA